jgi:hypothetical protein
MSGEISPTGEPPGPGTSPELRASHADRDRVVDVLRVAAGDGRLTVAELDERLEAALSARTIGELAVLTADLPIVAGMSGLAAEEAKDVIRIDQRGSSVRRTDHWVVPRRMELWSSWGEVTLDFTHAVITQDTLRIDMDVRGGSLILVTRPGIVVNTDSLAVSYANIKIRQTADLSTPVTLRVELVGRIHHGRVVARSPRRTFWQWLLRKPASLPSPTG